MAFLYLILKYIIIRRSYFYLALSIVITELSSITNHFIPAYFTCFVVSYLQCTCRCSFPQPTQQNALHKPHRCTKSFVHFVCQRGGTYGFKLCQRRSILSSPAGLVYLYILMFSDKPPFLTSSVRLHCSRSISIHIKSYATIKVDLWVNQLSPVASAFICLSQHTYPCDILMCQEEVLNNFVHLYADTDKLVEKYRSCLGRPLVSHYLQCRKKY